MEYEAAGGQEMIRDLYVIDLETTHLEPWAGHIVEVGICRVDLGRRCVFPEYGRIVNVDLDEDEKKAWVFQNTDLTPDDVEQSPYGWPIIAFELQRLMMHGVFTSYNQSFDFGWLEQYGIMPDFTADIMDMVTDDYGRRLSAQAAYRYYCPDNPARLPQSTEDHRALSDAVMESYILLEMCKSGIYRRTVLNDLVTQ